MPGNANAREIDKVEYRKCSTIKTENTTGCNLLLKGKASLKENIIKMKDLLFPNILVQV